MTATDPQNDPSADPTTPNGATRSGRMLNNATHGQRLRMLKLGGMPKPLERPEREAWDYRRGLESATERQYGTISVTHAHTIDAATSEHLHSLTCAWLLREKIADMTPTDIMKCSSTIASARQARNRCVARLELDGQTAGEAPADYDPWLDPALAPALAEDEEQQQEDVIAPDEQDFDTLPANARRLMANKHRQQRDD